MKKFEFTGMEKTNDRSEVMVDLIADDEARERQLLLGKYRNLEHELDGMKDQLDQESASRDDLARQFNKADAEANMWRQRYETEAVAKAEELEMAKMKASVKYIFSKFAGW